jgi:rod shape-determining protein MreC
LSRRQLIFFLSLVTLSVISLLLHEPTKLVFSTRLSSVLLFPIKTITGIVEFLTISNSRIQKLETTVNRLKLENAELREKALQDTTELTETRFTLLKARVTGRDPSNINAYLYIDKGREYQVYVNQPVISMGGLVGKIKFVDNHYSIVETIESQNFAVSALDLENGIHGIVKQREGLVFDYVRKTDEIAIGDSLYTSGMSEIFPAGILIGTVQDIQPMDDLFFTKVFVISSAQVNRLTSVYVLFAKKTSLSEKGREMTSE